MALKDPLVTEALRELRNAAVRELVAHGRPVCRFPLHFNGAHPPADACDCTCPGADGQGWARMVTINHQTGAERWNVCLNGRFDITLEIGVYRCSPVPTEGNLLVPEEVEEDHALGMLLDAAALRRAVRCNPWFEQHEVTPLILHESAIGPSGGCVGVELQMRFTHTECGC